MANEEKHMTDESRAARTIARDCIGFRLRMLGRAVTELYDDALRPHGLRVSQLSILTAVGRRGGLRPSELARALHMDKSTVTRDIERLLKYGWLEQSPGDDARTYTLRLTPAGDEMLEKILPAWREAQGRAAELLGEQAVAALFGAVENLRQANAPEG
jgi:DNA-binding MarR family transcriptional regulator